MIGRRLDHIIGDLEWPAKDCQEGDYGKDEKGRWYAWPPTVGCALMLTGHSERMDWTVVEHTDKTITVSPSLFVSPPTGWHGHLVNGIWVKC